MINPNELAYVRNLQDKQTTLRAKNTDLRKSNKALEAKIAELEATVKSLTDGVAHFNRSHGGMTPLLTAYVEALKEDK